MDKPWDQTKLRLALNEQLTVLSVDDGIECLLGFSAEEISAARVRLSERVHPKDADVAGSLFSPSLDVRSGTINLRLRHADGRIRCLRGEYQKRVEPVGGDAILELTLKDARSLWSNLGEQPMGSHLQALMENSDDYIFFKDRNHVFTSASQSLLDWCKADCNIGSLLGMTDYDLFPEKEADIYYGLEKQVFTGVPFASEVHLSQRSDGRPIWLSNQRFPIKDDRGETIGLFGVVRDVSRQMVADLARKNAEAEYQTVLDVAMLGVFRASLDGRLLFANRAAAQILGYDSAEDLLKSVTDAGRDLWVNPLDRLHHLKEMQETDSAAGRRLECQFRRKDGTTVWVSINCKLTCGADGTVLHIDGIFLDITERKETEAKLRESEDSLKTAQQIAGLGSYVTYISEGRWTSSAILDQTFGIGPEFNRTIEGWSELIFPDDREQMVCYFLDEVAGKGKPFDREYRIIRQSDGAVRWVHGLGRLEKDNAGRPVKMIGTIQDITEQKLADAALRESRARLQLFISDAPVALAMFDREMRYLAVSLRWAKDHAVSAQELVGRSHYVVNPEVPERWKETHRRGLAGERQRSEEDRYDRADGALQWIRWEIIPWHADDGSVGGIIMYYEDITARRQAEASLRESKELLQLFIAHAPAAMAMFDTEMRYVAASRRWLEENSLEGRPIIGHCHYEITPDIPARWKEAHRRGLAGETLRQDDDRFERADGTIQWTRWAVIPWRTAEGEIGGIILFAEDITRQKEAE